MTWSGAILTLAFILAASAFGYTAWRYQTVTGWSRDPQTVGLLSVVAVGFLLLAAWRVWRSGGGGKDDVAQ